MGQEPIGRFLKKMEEARGRCTFHVLVAMISSSSTIVKVELLIFEVMFVEIFVDIFALLSRARICLGTDWRDIRGTFAGFW